MGGSYKTTYFGAFLIALDLFKFIGDAVKTQGLPTSIDGWIVFASGIAAGLGLILAKDYNVSNAVHQQAPTVVPVSITQTEPVQQTIPVNPNLNK